MERRKRGWKYRRKTGEGRRGRADEWVGGHRERAAKEEERVGRPRNRDRGVNEQRRRRGELGVCAA